MMRKRRLFIAATVAAALLAATATAASAHKHPSANGCQVNINVAPRLIEAGETALVFGRLRCPGRPRAAAGRAVHLLAKVAGSSGFEPVQSTSTDARGFYELARV